MSEHVEHAAHAPAVPGHDPHGHGHEEHIHEASHYVKIWAALLVLFAISVTGPMVGIKWLTLVTAFGIAIVKASVVVKFFMHLDLEQRFVHYFLTISLLFMFLFFFAVAPDVMNHTGSNWTNVAAKQAVAAGLAAGDGHGEHGGEHGAAHDPATPDGHAPVGNDPGTHEPAIGGGGHGSAEAGSHGEGH